MGQELPSGVALFFCVCLVPWDLPWVLGGGGSSCSRKLNSVMAQNLHSGVGDIHFP